ncbi:carboxylesterase family protein [Patulibacter medicamentivorans]|uniref:carboxylesterase family protein n=1 Tax=Patulibacter medicamentivorans TaxID=1097667 RepID=UPI00067FEE4D|nr:carboxylesterase family protein [Patulibacter medicamentivorans]
MRRSGPIRYATADRFGAPRPVADDRSSTGAICPQAPSRLESVMGSPDPRLPQDDDCLNLSITTPACDDHRRPVMVWLHGGAFLTGGGLQAWYDGGRLTTEQDVVVVSVNYRLGVFGFLRLDGVSEGNLGLLDQLEALRWVRRHIAAYGGDPENVTVFGQSAGGLSVALLLGMAQTRGLFHRAIVQSAPVGARHTPDQAAAFGQAVARHLGADPRGATPAGLLEATARAAAARRSRSPLDVPFAPIAGVHPVAADIDRALVAGADGRDVLCGCTTDEATAFGIPLAAAAELTEALFGEPSARFRAQLAAAGSRVLSYRVDWRPAGSPFGATHCVELPLLLGDERSWRAAPMLGDVPWSEVEELGKATRRAWAAFARTGTPDDRDLGRWPLAIE